MSGSRGEGRPPFEVPWSGRWSGFREGLRVLFTLFPMLPPQAALSAFHLPDVTRGWPKGAFLLSVALHVAFLASPLPEFITRPAAITTTLQQVRIEYDLEWTGGARYLPSVSPTRESQPAEPQRSAEEQPAPREADAVEEQTIVSKPPEANHPRQTLLTQFGLEKTRVRAPDVRLPNMVVPAQPDAEPASEIDLRELRAPRLEAPVPPRPKSKAELALEQTRLENLYPKLAAEPGTGSETSGAAPEVSLPASPSGDEGNAPGILALSAQPAVPRPVLELPDTNLRARFAVGGQAEGEGPPDAGGELEAPDVRVTPAGPAPSGPVVVGPAGGDANPPRPAMPRPPPSRASSGPSRSAPRVPQDEEAVKERAEAMIEGVRPGSRAGVARGKPVYTTYINMPNLGSQSGSWALRFTELGETSTVAPGGAANGLGLEAPVPMKKVDPRYPARARREEIEGTVFLYAVIRADGTVDNVQVVRKVHKLLDQSAVEAFQRWRFRPGRKNGVPVALEVVVEIPFRLRKLF